MTIKQFDPIWIPEERVKFEKILNISAKTNLNVEELCLGIREILDQQDDKARANEEQHSSESHKTTKTIRNSDELAISNLIF